MLTAHAGIIPSIKGSSRMPASGRRVGNGRFAFCWKLPWQEPSPSSPCWRADTPRLFQVAGIRVGGRIAARNSSEPCTRLDRLPGDIPRSGRTDWRCRRYGVAGSSRDVDTSAACALDRSCDPAAGGVIKIYWLRNIPSYSRANRKLPFVRRTCTDKRSNV